MLQRALLWVYGQRNERYVEELIAYYYLLRNLDAIVNAHPAAAKTLDTASQGASLFLDPTGAQVGDQVQAEEGIAYADLDLNACVEPKQIHDVVGSYQRFDIFDLRVNRSRLGPSFYQEIEVDKGVDDLRSSPIDATDGEIQRLKT